MSRDTRLRRREDMTAKEVYMLVLALHYTDHDVQKLHGYLEIVPPWVFCVLEGLQAKHESICRLRYH